MDKYDESAPSVCTQLTDGTRYALCKWQCAFTLLKEYPRTNEVVVTLHGCPPKRQEQRC